MALRREQLLGAVFRCKTAWQQDRTSLRITRGETGFVTHVSNDLSQVHITIISRQPRASMQHVPVANLDIGVQYIADTRSIPLVLQGLSISSVRNHSASEPTYRNDNDPFRKSVATFFSAIWSNKGRIPHLNRHHEALINTDVSIMRTVETFRSHVGMNNPQFFATLGDPRSTLEDFLQVLAPSDRNDKVPGIYLAVVDRFKEGSNRGNLGPHAYVGQSVSIGVRIGSHESEGKKVDGKQEIHRAMKDGGRTRWFKLAEQLDEEEGGSAASGTAMRDLMETTFMMIFNSMSSRVMAPSVNATATVQTDVAHDYTDFEMARLFTDLAREAFRRHGVSLPSPARSPAFGLHRYGCNYTIPFGGEAVDAYDRTTWCRHDAGDRWLFYRGRLTLQKDLHVCRMRYRDHQHDANKALQVEVTPADAKAMDFKIGRRYLVIWEVQKPGQGQHPVPFFRLSEIGPWSNWSYANKVAFKLMWQTSDGTWKTRYFQRQAKLRLVSDCTDQGAHVDYALGVGVYCFFIRSTFPKAQEWSASFGLARVITATLEELTQHITVAHVLTAGEVLTGPCFSTKVCRLMMEALGLHNVDGRWQSFDWSWLNEPEHWENGEVPALRSLNSLKQREKCDFCYIADKSGLAKVHSQTLKCERVPGTNYCAPCWKMGRPCSFTGLPFIFGSEWKAETAKKGSQKTLKGEKFVRALLCHPYTPEAGIAHDVGSDSHLQELGEDRTQQYVPIDWDHLTSADQSNFNQWDRNVTTTMNDMLRHIPGTLAHQAHRQELDTLTRFASSNLLSTDLRAYMRSYVERDINYFNTHGQIYQRPRRT